MLLTSSTLPMHSRFGTALPEILCATQEQQWLRQAAQGTDYLLDTVQVPGLHWPNHLSRKGEIFYGVAHGTTETEFLYLHRTCWRGRCLFPAENATLAYDWNVEFAGILSSLFHLKYPCFSYVPLRLAVFWFLFFILLF